MAATRGRAGRRRLDELEPEADTRKKRRTRLKSGGRALGKAPRAWPDRRERAESRDVGGGLDPIDQPTPAAGRLSAAVPHVKSPVPPPQPAAVRGSGPPPAPAAPKQDDPTATALSSLSAAEDLEDLSNNTTPGGGSNGANDNTRRQRGGRVRTF
jgi:hypothetical protein